MTFGFKPSNRQAVLALAACMMAALGTPVIAAAGKGQTQQEMDQQADRDFNKADQALNATYNRLLAKVSAKGKDALRQSERSWVKFRDDNCRFLTLGSSGGSVHPMVYSMCLTGATQERTKELNAQLHCEEGDLGCGGQ